MEAEMIPRLFTVSMTRPGYQNETKTSKSVTGLNEPYTMIMTDELTWYFNIFVFVIFCALTAVSGVASNFTNMVVFHRLGIKDSMSVCLFSLSLADFMVCCLIALGRGFLVWDFFYHDEGIDPLAVKFVGYVWITDSLFLCSGWILSLLSLERCLCVIFPFKVKRIFTKNRSIAVVVLVHVAVFSTCVPIYVTQSLVWIDIGIGAGDNGTDTRRRLVVVFTENRQRVEKVVHILNSSVIPVPALVITFGSALLMIYGLIKSSRLRHSMTSGQVNADGEKGDFKLTQKTRRLVMAVLLLAIIFLVCSIPRIIVKAINIIVPEAKEDGKERNLSNFIWEFARLSSCLNASVNIVVYLTINSSYREMFLRLFACQRAKEKPSRDVACL